MRRARTRLRMKMLRDAAVAEGRADLACGSTTNNAERRHQVAFTVPR